MGGFYNLHINKELLIKFSTVAEKMEDLVHGFKKHAAFLNNFYTQMSANSKENGIAGAGETLSETNLVLTPPPPPPSII